MLSIHSLMLALAILAPVFVPSGQQALPKGEVVSKVVCAAASNFSYSLYLPKAYDPAKKWPVVYCFDPGGRGSVPVKQFEAAAEEYGYIVAGSNDSHNGPNVPLESIIAALWEDTHSRFSIDEKRVYTSGFSGGARVAVAVAYSKQADVAGVIACSGGFPGSRKPDKNISFVFFGTTGVQDFNFPELFNLADTLDSLGVTNRLEFFDGEHEWAPPELCTEAIEWMEIQAIRLGRRTKDTALIQKLEARLAAIAESQESAGKSYLAWKSYASIVSDFAGLADTARFEAKAVELKNSKTAKDQLKQIKEEIKHQQLIASRLEQLKAAATLGTGSSASSDTNGGQQPLGTLNGSTSDESNQGKLAASSDLSREIKDLKKRLMGKEQTPDKIVASRVLSGFFVGCYELAEIYKSTKRYDLAAANLEFGSEVRPQSAGIYYSLAQTYALAGNKSKLLAALDKAISNGWTDADAIEKEKAFDPFRRDPAYARIIERLKEPKSSAKP